MENVLFICPLLITNLLILSYEFAPTIVTDSESVANKNFMNLPSWVLTIKMSHRFHEFGARLQTTV